MAVLPLYADGENNQKGAHIKFEQTEYNFGEMARDGKELSCIFRFVNDGTEPLVLYSALTSCSCVKTEFSRKPLAAGQSGELKIVIDASKLEKGIFHRVVQVRSNSVGGTENLIIEGITKE